MDLEQENKQLKEEKSLCAKEYERQFNEMKDMYWKESSKVSNLKQKLEKIKELCDEGFFNEAIYDGQGNFDQNDEDKTNKLKKILEEKP